MPTDYKRKTARGMASREIYELAVEQVTLHHKSLRDAASTYNLSHTSLYRYIKKKTAYDAYNTAPPPSVGYPEKTVFSSLEEQVLREYLLNCAAANFGLSTTEVRKFAYSFAVKYNKKCPPSWDGKKMAGDVWLRSFMKRHPLLSLRLPQPKSIARATTFSRTNVELFFRNYTTIIDKYKLEGKDIWNVDESGITTVQIPDEGEKEVSAMPERETLVSIALAGNAIGNYIPPMFMFPPKKNKDYFISDGSIGTANESVWMQENDFYTFLEFFRDQVGSSKENMVLLLLDNRSSHTSVKNIEFCQENGIVLLTFPPHCTHKLQPMDRAIFGQVKKAVNTACDNWMRSNPGESMTIYDIPGVVKTLLDRTPRNISSGFRTTGLWPVNAEIFQDSDYLPSRITDRVLLTVKSEAENPGNSHTASPSVQNLPPSSPNSFKTEDPDNTSTDLTMFKITPGTLSTTEAFAPFKDFSTSTEPVASTSHYTPVSFSPEIFRSLPKVPPQKRNQTNQRKLKSDSLTDPVIKVELAATDEEEEYFCICCFEPYSNSKAKEKWVQCLECKVWAHKACTGDEELFVCHNCLSE